nr:NADH dehydrogenase subunit 6 [Artemia salina]
MMSIMVIVSIFMILMNHPLAFTLSLFVQTLIMCLSIKSLSLWISLILFLIFLGGILVMFIYVSSLSANEKFSIQVAPLLWMIPVGVASVYALSFENNLVGSPMSKLYHQTPMMINFNINITSLFMYIFLVVYLFLALLLVIDFLNANKKPLRSMI